MPKSVLLACLVSLGACASSPSYIPVATAPSPDPELTLVWVGRGEAERFEGGRWVRIPAFDYEFNVEQRRYRDRWSSVKHLRRLHPAYDGSAGPRSQGMFFDLAFDKTTNPRVPVSITSTMGTGTGTADSEFRTASLEITADVSRFAPFDRYRITQAYNYEAGTLAEVVELVDGETPWVRNREVARLYAPHAFAAAPSRR